MVEGLNQLDLRVWIARAEALGELQVVKGAHWKRELGAIAYLNYRAKGGHKALLFDQIPDYPPGYRVLTGSISTPQRFGLALRLGEGLDHAALMAKLDGKTTQWEADAARYAAEFVGDGPICENVYGPKEFDLMKFPVPLWHRHDGGRYIGTGDACITMHPETGAVNVGCYRMMVHDSQTVTACINPQRQVRENMFPWFAKEGRCPIVCSVGHDPLLFALAGNEIPLGISEIDYAGAVLGQRVPVIRGVTGLPIPATSEIAIEGWIYPNRRRMEGPFGEWHGHYSELQRDGTRVENTDFDIEVVRVYHRNNPIILGAPPGKPPHDFTYFRTALKSASVKDHLIKSGIPGVKSVWMSEGSGARCFMVVSVNQSYVGHARQVGMAATSCPAAWYALKWVIVVDDDVDPSNMEEVIWALSFRCQPSEDIEIIRKTMGTRGDVSIGGSSQDENWMVASTSRAIIDACIPFERKQKSWVVCDLEPEVAAATRERWAQLWK